MHLSQSLLVCFGNVFLVLSILYLIFVCQRRVITPLRTFSWVILANIENKSRSLWNSIYYNSDVTKKLLWHQMKGIRLEFGGLKKYTLGKRLLTFTFDYSTSTLIIVDCMEFKWFVFPWRSPKSMRWDLELLSVIKIYLSNGSIISDQSCRLLKRKTKKKSKEWRKLIINKINK